jgi:hypothetical protein
MKELLDKLSSYNLFNYLLPGTVFVAAAQRISEHRFKDDNVVIEMFVYYFIGLVISRLGSLVLEPLFKKTKFVAYAPYPDFVRASAQDSRIEILSEQNNMFRTLCALFLALLGLKCVDLVASWFGASTGVAWPLTCGALFVMFAFAYRKQTRYVKQRVEAALK